MAVQATDLILISRAGVNYKALVSDLPSGGGSDPWGWSKLAADSAANSTVTLATSGLSFAAAANTTYIVRIVGGFTAAATTTGIAMALDVPAGCTVAGTGYHMTSNVGASAGFEQIADNATIGATTGVRAANTLVPIEASWIIETTTAGTATLMFRSEVAGSAVTLKKPFAFGARAI